MFNNGLEKNPDSSELNNNLGSVYSDEGRYAEALPYYRKAIKLNPNLAAAYFNLAGALIQVKRVDEAIKPLTVAIEIEPRFVAAQQRLGEIHLQLAKQAGMKSDYETERDHYRKALGCYAQAFAITGDRELGDIVRQLTNRIKTLP
jgi:tetratricopeptide (TPR) repeat protein